VHSLSPRLAVPRPPSELNRSSRILLVGESADEREMYAVRFRSEGFCTLQARTATDAYRLASELSPVVIVTDLRLAGDEDGAALARRLKNTPQTCAAKVVILTSYLAVEDAAQFREDTCDLLLVKPCLPDALLHAAERLIQQ
jgi:CheY-like chemotaxis protein